jgi:hypothetical protein
LLVWSRSCQWSADVAHNVGSVDADGLAVRTICADSIEVRSELANGIPRVDGIPALIVVESDPTAGKSTTITYNREEIRGALELCGCVVGGSRIPREPLSEAEPLQSFSVRGAAGGTQRESRARGRLLSPLAPP